MSAWNKIRESEWFIPIMILTAVSAVVTFKFAFTPCGWSLEEIQRDNFEELRGVTRFVIGIGVGLAFGCCYLKLSPSPESIGSAATIAFLAAGIVTAMPYIVAIRQVGLFNFLMEDFR